MHQLVFPVGLVPDRANLHSFIIGFHDGPELSFSLM